MTDILWADVFKTIPWQDDIPSREYWYFHPDWNATINLDEARKRGVKHTIVWIDFDAHHTIHENTHKRLIVRNVSSELNPTICFSDAVIDTNNGCLNYKSVYVFSRKVEKFIPQMIDFDILRLEFFKNPIDKIGYALSQEQTNDFMMTRTVTIKPTQRKLSDKWTIETTPDVIPYYQLPARRKTKTK